MGREILKEKVAAVLAAAMLSLSWQSSDALAATHEIEAMGQVERRDGENYSECQSRALLAAKRHAVDQILQLLSEESVREMGDVMTDNNIEQLSIAFYTVKPNIVYENLGTVCRATIQVQYDDEDFPLMLKRLQEIKQQKINSGLEARNAEQRLEVERKRRQADQARASRRGNALVEEVTGSIMNGHELKRIQRIYTLKHRSILYSYDNENQYYQIVSFGMIGGYTHLSDRACVEIVATVNESTGKFYADGTIGMIPTSLRIYLVDPLDKRWRVEAATPVGKEGQIFWDRTIKVDNSDNSWETMSSETYDKVISMIPQGVQKKLQDMNDNWFKRE